MKATIKTTWAEIKAKTGRDGVEFIAVTALGKYGFTAQIVLDMIKYEIFPQAFQVCGEVYVIREHIFGQVVRKLLENSMVLYTSVAEADEITEKVQAAMEDVVLDEEAVAKLDSGEWTMDYVRERSAKLLAEKTETSTTEEPA